MRAKDELTDRIERVLLLENDLDERESTSASRQAAERIVELMRGCGETIERSKTAALEKLREKVARAAKLPEPRSSRPLAASEAKR